MVELRSQKAHQNASHRLPLLVPLQIIVFRGLSACRSKFETEVMVVVSTRSPRHVWWFEVRGRSSLFTARAQFLFDFITRELDSTHDYSLASKSRNTVETNKNG
jgi:hypothetical protein